MTVALDARWRISRDVAYELVQGEAVALNLKTGLYYKLNHVAACAFDYLARGLALRDLEDFLLREFEVDRATLRGDLVGLLADLEKYGLVIRGPRTESGCDGGRGSEAE